MTQFLKRSMDLNMKPKTHTSVIIEQQAGQFYAYINAY